MKLRLLVVEEAVRYAGSNGIRFHHHVVRAMPGGAEGIAVKDKVFKHTAKANLAEIRNGADEVPQRLRRRDPESPVRGPDRPMDMKAVRVIALVQNDKTGEIVQALQIELEGKPKALPGSTDSPIERTTAWARSFARLRPRPISHHHGRRGRPDEANPR